MNYARWKGGLTRSRAGRTAIRSHLYLGRTMSEQTQIDSLVSTPPQAEPVLEAEPAARVPLRELGDGQRVGGVYAVRERELRRKRNGEPWLRLSLGDAGGACEAVAWEEAEERYAIAAPGTPVFVSGVFEVSERWGGKIKLSDLREASPDEYRADDLAAEAEIPFERLESDLRE